MASVRVGAKTTDRDGIIVETGSIIRKQVLEKVECRRDRANLESLDVLVVRQLTRFISEVIDGVRSHDLSPGLGVLLEERIPSFGLGIGGGAACRLLGFLELVGGCDTNILVKGSSLVSLEMNVKGLSNGGGVGANAVALGSAAVAGGGRKVSLRDNPASGLGETVGVHGRVDGGLKLVVVAREMSAASSEMASQSAAAVEQIGDGTIGVSAGRNGSLCRDDIVAFSAEDDAVVDVEGGSSGVLLGLPGVRPLGDTSLEGQGRFEVGNGGVERRAVQAGLAKLEANSGRVGDTSDERIPAVLSQPGEIRASGVLLGVVEAGDGREGQAGIEQWPSIRGGRARRIGLVGVYFEERSGCSKGSSNVAIGEGNARLVLSRDIFVCSKRPVLLVPAREVRSRREVHCLNSLDEPSGVEETHHAREVQFRVTPLNWFHTRVQSYNKTWQRSRGRARLFRVFIPRPTLSWRRKLGN